MLYLQTEKYSIRIKFTQELIYSLKVFGVCARESGDIFFYIPTCFIYDLFGVHLRILSMQL